MRNTFSILATALAVTVGIASAAIGQSTNSAATGGSSVMPRHVKSATAVGEVFGDGEKISAAIIEYDRDINQSKLSPSAFSVVGRTITKVYANNAPAKATRGSNGKYVIIELSPDDKDASLYVGGAGAGRGPGGAGGPGGTAGPGGAGAAPGATPNTQANGSGAARPATGMGMGMSSKKDRKSVV